MQIQRDQKSERIILALFTFVRNSKDLNYLETNLLFNSGFITPNNEDVLHLSDKGINLYQGLVTKTEQAID